VYITAVCLPSLTEHHNANWKRKMWDGVKSTVLWRQKENMMESHTYSQPKFSSSINPIPSISFLLMIVHWIS